MSAVPQPDRAVDQPTPLVVTLRAEGLGKAYGAVNVLSDVNRW